VKLWDVGQAHVQMSLSVMVCDYASRQLTMDQSTAADTLDVNPDWATMLAQINPTLDLQNPQLQCQLLYLMY
jgi:hypothetical protein